MVGAEAIDTNVQMSGSMVNEVTDEVKSLTNLTEYMMFYFNIVHL
jgi:hypothetical protein